MKTKKLQQRLLSGILTILMTLSFFPATVLAENPNEIQFLAATEDEVSVASSDTYSLTLKENAGGTLTIISIFSPEEEESSAEITDLDCIPEGSTITFTVTPSSSRYTLYSVGYWKISDNGSVGSLTSLSASSDGSYSFTMPDYNIGLGASFEDTGNYPTLSDTNIREDKWDLYVSLQDAWLHPSDNYIEARIVIDERFLTECSDTQLIAELRQYSTGGYTLVGSKTYSPSELVALCQSGTLSNGLYTIDHVKFELDSNSAFLEGYYVYCYLKAGRPDWIDARGEGVYRTAYTEDATVLAEGAVEPAPIVWLYNLDENSYRGSVIRSILDDLQIPYATINSSNLGQNIGYLVSWEGYDPVDDPYCDAEYDVEYILMGNLVETDLDDFLDAMSANNIHVNLKSVPTAWTASKTFQELFEIMATEDAAFSAIVDLDSMIYEASKIVDNQEYITSEFYPSFLEAYNTAIVALTEELEAEEYEAYTQALLEAYLKVTEKTSLTGNVELILIENDDGTYTVSAQLTDGPENASFIYSWQDASSKETLIIPASDVYKVKLTLTGTGSFYGSLTAQFSVPVHPGIILSTESTSITVIFTAPEEVLNTPDVTEYIAELYDADGTFLQTLTCTEAGSVTFTELAAETSYTLKTWLVNPVGRSDILDQTVSTSSKNPSSSDSSSSSDTSLSSDNSSSSGGGGGGSSSVWSVVAENSDHGRISLSSTRASKGNTIKITVTPDTGYELDELTVTDTSGNKLAVTDLGNSQYSFTMPSSQVKIVSSFTEISSTASEKDENNNKESNEKTNESSFDSSDNALRFDDVNSTDYFYEAVLWAVENGITAGTSDTAFSPDVVCTRAQIVTFLWRRAGSPLSDGMNPFEDVSEEDPFYHAILWAVNKGIAAGASETAFHPGDPVSRAQAVTFLWREAGSPLSDGMNPFEDITSDCYYYEAVLWAVGNGITAGTSDTAFNPDAACTRAQIVTFLYREK